MKYIWEVVELLVLSGGTLEKTSVSFKVTMQPFITFETHFDGVSLTLQSGQVALNVSAILIILLYI